MCSSDLQMILCRVFRRGEGDKRSHGGFSGAAEGPYASLRFKSLIPVRRRFCGAHTDLEIAARPEPHPTGISEHCPGKHLPGKTCRKRQKMPGLGGANPCKSRIIKDGKRKKHGGTPSAL